MIFDLKTFAFLTFRPDTLIEREFLWVMMTVNMSSENQEMNY